MLRFVKFNLLALLMAGALDVGGDPRWSLATELPSPNALVTNQNAINSAVDSESPAIRTAAWPFFNRWRRPIYDSSGTNPTPHPAVARIIVPEGGMTAYGSGTLVDAREEYGLVVTNWHVVHDSKGVVEVVFPSGFRSQARPLKVDSDWDLAALVIWRPPIEPVKMADCTPQPGDLLTIHGYGQGEYRIATGRCTGYYAPRLDFPREMVELDVEARQGDSGGPIFNQRGELAGVLFGAGEGTTLGSFAPRVETFLASLAPDIGLAQDQSQLAVADRAPPAVHSLNDANEPVCATGSCPYATESANDRTNAGWASASNHPSSPWSPPTKNSPANAASEVQLAAGNANADGAHTALSWQDLAGSSWFEPAKSVLAAVGLAAIALQVVKLVR